MGSHAIKASSMPLVDKRVNDSHAHMESPEKAPKFHRHSRAAEAKKATACSRRTYRRNDDTNNHSRPPLSAPQDKRGTISFLQRTLSCRVVSSCFGLFNLATTSLHTIRISPSLWRGFALFLPQRPAPPPNAATVICCCEATAIRWAIQALSLLVPTCLTCPLISSYITGKPSRTSLHVVWQREVIPSCRTSRH